MRRHGARASVAMLVFGLVLAGCGEDEKPSGAASDNASPPMSSSDADGDLDRSRKFLAKVHAEGTGANPFTWEGEQEIVLTRVGRQGLDVNLLSAGFAMPQIVANDRALRFRWAFDLLNAYADEPGTFTIDGVAQGQQGLRSSAFLVLLKAKDPAQAVLHDMDEAEFLKQFNELRKPCTVEVGEGERTGTLTCPELATADGETAGLAVRWEQSGPDQPAG